MHARLPWFWRILNHSEWLFSIVARRLGHGCYRRASQNSISMPPSYEQAPASPVELLMQLRYPNGSDNTCLGAAGADTGDSLAAHQFSHRFALGHRLDVSRARRIQDDERRSLASRTQGANESDRPAQQVGRRPSARRRGGAPRGAGEPSGARSEGPSKAVDGARMGPSR